MPRLNNKKQKGFTIIESVIYIALLVIMTGALVEAMVKLSVYYRQVNEIVAVESSGINAMDRIIRETRSASSINSAGSAFNISSGALSLNTTNAVGSSTVIKFALATTTGKIMLYEDNASLGPLTSENAFVSSLVFKQYSTTTSAAVKVEMIIDGMSSSTSHVSENFYGTAVLRGSY